MTLNNMNDILNDLLWVKQYWNTKRVKTNLWRKSAIGLHFFNYIKFTKEDKIRYNTPEYVCGISWVETTFPTHFQDDIDSEHIKIIWEKNHKRIISDIRFMDSVSHKIKFYIKQYFNIFKKKIIKWN